MKNPNKKFLSKIFEKYYNNVEFGDIEEFDKREFGIVHWNYPKWEEGFWKRYFQFNNSKKLKDYILNENNPPSDLYFSVCVYDNPTEREGYKWADLPIEFDIDDFYECPNNHSKELFCDDCYDFMIESALKLKEVLLNDFGLKEENIKVKFSGHRGMHFRITNNKVRKLSSEGRTKIVNYLTANNVLHKKLGFYVTKNKNDKFVWKGPNPEQPGWKGRCCDAIAKWLNNQEYEDLKDLISKKGAKALDDNRSNFSIAKKGNWDYVFPENVFPMDVQKIVEKSCENYLPQPDTKVAIDTKRVFRVPNSAHHFGLSAKKINLNEIEKFNVWKDSCLYEDENHKIDLKLKKDLPNIKLNDKEYEGKKGDKINNILLAPATTLISKNYAKIINF